MILSDALARSSGNNDFKLFAEPRTQEAKDIVRKHGLSYIHKRKPIDILLVDNNRPDKMLLACESEAHERQFTTPNLAELNPKTGKPKRGYIWDVSKLLKSGAQHLLFVARVGDSSTSSWQTRLTSLRESLHLYAKEHASDWSQSRLDIVLLPAEPHLKSEVVLGVAMNGGDILFDNL
jgi:hypothetical protein